MVEFDPDDRPKQSMAIKVMDGDSKYLYEQLAQWLALAVCLLAFISLAFMFSTPNMLKSMHSSQGLILLVTVLALFIAFFIFALRSLKQSISEAKLLHSDKLPGFVIDADGISGSIVMLEGSQRDQIYRSGSPRFTLEWNEIAKVRFIPAKSDGNSSSPPYMIIHPQGAGQHANDYLVLRDSFYHKEQQIIDLLNSHDIQVDIEGPIH